MKKKNEMTLWKVLNFEGIDLPTFEINGKPYWIAGDVGKALGYKDGREMVAMISRNWSDEFTRGEDFMILRGQDLKDFKALVGVGDGSSLTYAPQVMLLAEEGIYLCGIKSGKPEGVRMRKWFKGDVMPSLRKTGSYSVEKTSDYSIDSGIMPDHEQAMRGWADEMAHVKLLKSKIEEDAPSVEFAKGVEGNSSLVSMDEWVALVSRDGHYIGRNKTYAKLREMKILKDNNVPHANHRGCGRFEVRYSKICGRWEPQTFLTGKGQIWLFEKLREVGYIPDRVKSPAQLSLKDVK